jgi:hypothetical protein
LEIFFRGGMQFFSPPGEMLGDILVFHRLICRGYGYVNIMIISIKKYYE